MNVVNRSTSGLRKGVEHQWLWDQILFRRIRGCIVCGLDGSYDVREPEPVIPDCRRLDGREIAAARAAFDELRRYEDELGIKY